VVSAKQKERRKELGLCVTCGQRPSRNGRTNCQKCANTAHARYLKNKGCILNAAAEWRKANPDRVKEQQAHYRETHKEKIQRYRTTHKKEFATTQALYRYNLKKRIWVHYFEGRYTCDRCSNSFDLRILHMHHINGDGYEQRATLSKKEDSTSYYKSLVDRGFPNQVVESLCPNCHAEAHLLQHRHNLFNT
jgi:hypothetical protein